MGREGFVTSSLLLGVTRQPKLRIPKFWHHDQVEGPTCQMKRKEVNRAISEVDAVESETI